MLSKLIVTALALGAVFVWRLVRLENRLKGYRGQGEISLISGRIPLWVQYCVRLPNLPTTGSVHYDLSGLPGRRIYSVALVIPSKQEIPAWEVRPFRLELSNHGQIKTVADAAVLPLASHFTGEINRFHFPVQTSFKATPDNQWSFEVTVPEITRGKVSSSAYLLITSQRI